MVETEGSPKAPEPVKARLLELALLFLRLGATAFGGPAAHIGMMEDEVVRRRRWLTAEEFLDHLGATNLLPGPNSTELAIHVGYVRCGVPGLLVAGICFIAPAAVIVSALAWAYTRFGSLPQVGGILYGVKPVVIAIVLQAIWGLARTAVKSRFLGMVGAVAIVLAMLGVHELAVIFGAGSLVCATRWRVKPRGSGLTPLLSLLGMVSLLPAAALVLPKFAPGLKHFGLGSLFLVFLKIGSVLFGSGYVLLAFLRADLVDRTQWITASQLLDAIAVGQVTPGPLFTTATFVGWILAGPVGALTATVGIFLPAFLFVAISGPLVPKLRQSPMAGGFLDGVNVASLAVMAVVNWQLAQAALVDGLTMGLAVAAGVALLKYRVNSVWLITAGVVAGLLASALGWRAG